MEGIMSQTEKVYGGEQFLFRFLWHSIEKSHDSTCDYV